MIVFYVLRRIAKKKRIFKASSGLMTKCSGVVILVVYIFLPLSSRALFGCFRCEDFDDGSELLQADYSLSCKDDRYTLMVAYALVMLFIWPLGIPALFSVLLWRRREQLQVLGVAKDRSELGQPAATEAELLKIRDDDESLDLIRLLFDAYRPEAWYWELVVTLRRLLITGAIVLLEKGSVVQYTAGLMLCFVAACMQASYQPYRELSENRMALGVESNLVAVLYLSFLSGLNMSSFEGDTGKNIGLLFVVLTVICVCTGLALVAHEVFYDSPEVARSASLFLRRSKAASRSAYDFRSSKHQSAGSSGGSLEMTSLPEGGGEATKNRGANAAATTSDAPLPADVTFARVPSSQASSSRVVESPITGGRSEELDTIEEQLDAKTGNTFFFNKATGETSWIRDSLSSAAGIKTAAEGDHDRRKSEHHLRLSGAYKAGAKQSVGIRRPSEVVSGDVKNRTSGAGDAGAGKSQKAGKAGKAREHDDDLFLTFDLFSGGI